ncbi:MAG TPA: branched-chain amino acid ABC transporter permease [Ideonella sp.]|nr:branched-chain amino acid ABC transporter permease [Ideonella sp.]
MEAFAHQVLSGLASGLIYASLALALVMVHRSTHRLNFAQGEMAMFATYVAWALIDAGLPYWGAFAVAVVLAFVSGAAIQHLLIRRVRSDSVLPVVVVFIGLLISFNSLAGWIFSYQLKVFPSPFAELPMFAQTWVAPHALGAALVILLILVALVVFFRFTLLGLKMRAVAQNPVSSRLLGIRVDAMLALGWGLAAAIGAVAGMMVAPIVYLEPSMMSGILLYAFAAALIGGIDSPAGSVVGGLLVGVLENLLGAYVIGNDLKLVVALVVIVATLLVRPAGLFGSAPVVRV